MASCWVLVAFLLALTMRVHALSHPCPMDPSHKFLVEFHEHETSPVAFANQHGLIYAGAHSAHPTVHRFYACNASEDALGPLEEALEVLHHPNVKRNVAFPVKFYSKPTPRPREKRIVTISDPKFKDQWHLHGNRKHLNCMEAWSQGFMGQGVRIAIVDDGLEEEHPDIKDNLRLDSSYNFNVDIPSPNPRYKTGISGDWHGTASGGAAAARDDGNTCGVGVAPRAELAGIAILQNNADVDDDVEAEALGYKSQLNHIYSNSWGPIRPGTGGHQNEGPGPLATRTIELAIKEGRGGLGSIYIWAAGNDGSSNDNCNYDGYANMRYVILIGAADPEGYPGSYSEPCAALLALAPGGNIAGPKIVTSDLMGSYGLSKTSDCTEYAGTSAACPEAAGAVALLLQANPNVTWLEVQYILAAATIRHNDDDRWRKNGAGRWVSEEYGFGLLNAGAIVESALLWDNRSLKERTIIRTMTTSVDRTREDVSFTQVEVDIPIHHVEVNLWTTHVSVSDTTILLTSPSNFTSILATPHGDMGSKWNGWRFLSRLYHGESSKGMWTLKVQTNRDAVARITKWTLTLHGLDLVQGDKPPNYQPPETEPKPGDKSTPSAPRPSSPPLSHGNNNVDLPGRSGSGWSVRENSLDMVVIAAICVALLIGAGIMLMYRFYSASFGNPFNLGFERLAPEPQDRV